MRRFWRGWRGLKLSEVEVEVDLIFSTIRGPAFVQIDSYTNERRFITMI